MDQLASTDAEHYRYDDRIVGWFLFATAVWGLVATLLTSYSWLSLIYADSLAIEYSYARFGNLHLSTLIYGLGANGLFAAIYFSTQRLCKSEMWSRGLSRAHFWGLQFILAWGLGTVWGGHLERRVGLEWVFLIDLALIAVAGVFTLNLMMTVLCRRERHAYISLWYYLASAFGVLGVQIVSSAGFPASGYESQPLFAGVADGLIQVWAQPSILFYLLLMPSVGVLYYFVPKASGSAIPNYRMAILQFWFMTALGMFVASRMLYLTPAPESLASLGRLASLLLLLPAWVGVTNGWKMLFGPSKDVKKSPMLQYAMVGILLYAIVLIDIGLNSFRYFSARTVFTDWSLAHVYAIFGCALMFVFASAAWVIPQIYHRQIWNKSLYRVQGGVGVVGALLLSLPCYVSGWTGGSMAMSVDSIGTLNYPEFVELLQATQAWWWLSLVGAVLCVVSVLLMSVNLLMTAILQQGDEAVRKTIAPKLSLEYADEPPPESVLAGQPVLDLGVKLDQWRSLTFHRKWERNPGILVAAVLAVLGLGVACHLGGAVASNPSEIQLADASSHYSPLELAGREIYVREGCSNCHTQVVRKLVAETSRYGDFSVAGAYMADQPTVWGTRRVGPDLARESGKRDGFWHWQHLNDPRSTTPESIMPGFQHLSDNPLDLEQVRGLLQRQIARGIAYDSDLVEEDSLTLEDRLVGQTTPLEASLRASQEMVAADIVIGGGPAAQFESEAIALIAYLQRLGRDSVGQ